MRRFFYRIAIIAIFGYLSGPIFPGFAQEEFARIPNFWDKNVRLKSRGAPLPQVIRFIVDSKNAPFSFYDKFDRLAGYNVDLARALCIELVTQCTIQSWPQDELLDSLLDNKADIIMSPLAGETKIPKTVEYTSPYFRVPARFIGHKQDANDGTSSNFYEGRRIGYLESSKEGEYLKKYFQKGSLQAYQNYDQLFAQIEQRKIDYAFADGLIMAYWLHSKEPNSCCEFVGGPYLSEKHLGPGMRMLIKSSETERRYAIDRAMNSLYYNGKLAEIYLRWFPISIF